MKKITMIVALMGAFAVAGTAHAGYWDTCYSGQYGKAMVRGYTTCSHGLTVMSHFKAHVKYMEAGEIDKFYTRAGGRTWTCYHTMHSYNSTWDCFAGRPVDSEFKFISTIGADTRTVPAPPPVNPPAIPCGHCGLTHIP